MRKQENRNWIRLESRPRLSWTIGPIYHVTKWLLRNYFFKISPFNCHQEHPSTLYITGEKQEWHKKGEEIGEGSNVMRLERANSLKLLKIRTCQQAHIYFL